MYVLEDLWKGNIDPSGRAIREGSEYQKISHEAIECMNAFHKELSAEGKKVFDEYYSKEMILADLSEQDAFIKGIRFGAQFILDVIGEYRSQMPQIGECV